MELPISARVTIGVMRSDRRATQWVRSFLADKDRNPRANFGSLSISESAEPSAPNGVDRSLGVPRGATRGVTGTKKSADRSFLGSWAIWKEEEKTWTDTISTLLSAVPRWGLWARTLQGLRNRNTSFSSTYGTKKN